jgi:hypothetical protein
VSLGTQGSDDRGELAQVVEVPEGIPYLAVVDLQIDVHQDVAHSGSRGEALD